MRLDWTAAAQAERRGQIAWIAARNQAAALRFDLRIEAQVNDLLDFPFMGRVGKVRGTRELVISRTKFIAIYTVVGEEVRILRFIHGKQRWPPRRRRSPRP